MSDQDWANGPAAAAGETLPANGHDEQGAWSRPGERSGRSPSPRRNDARERSRSPTLGSRTMANGNQESDSRGRTAEVQNPGNNLHVSGVSPKADDHDVEELFSNYDQSYITVQHTGFDPNTVGSTEPSKSQIFYRTLNLPMWNKMTMIQLLIISIFLTLCLIPIPASPSDALSWAYSSPRLASSFQCPLKTPPIRVTRDSHLFQKRAPQQNQLLVSTTSGKFLGFTTRSENNNNPVDVWRGIPYAKPPLGRGRFRAPVLARPPLDDPRIVQPAYEFGYACPQQPSRYLPVPVSEDCLTLNVYRPSDPKSVLDPLPVLVWIHGGSFTMGVSAAVDGSILVSSSVDLGKPIVLVSINYRLNSFGFLNTEELPVEDLQVGLKDQVASLEWLKLNVDKFGGDPEKITIWGQSAGGMSVALLVTYLPTPKDSSSALFRAAIMDSGSPTSHTVPSVSYYDQDGAPYDTLLKVTGCDGAAKTEGGSGLECLRSLPYDSLLDATSVVSHTQPYPRQLTIWGPSYKGGSIIDRRPSERLEDEDFLNIPVMMGTNKDEGALGAFSAGADYANSNYSSDDYFISYMLNTSVLDRSKVSPDVLKNLLKLYPDDPIVGSPFDTGNRTFGLPQIFKRLAAWYGDLHYQAPRRLWSRKTSSNQPTYVYYFDGPRNSSDPAFAGIPHSSELLLIFGIGYNNGLSETEIALNTRLTLQMRNHYLNFVYHLEPDSGWPRYTETGRKVLRFNKLFKNGEIIQDDWRSHQIDYLNSQRAIDTFLT